MSHWGIHRDSKPTYIAISLMVAFFAWLFWFSIFNQNTIGIDDANIFKVYAQNLTHGFGFVYQQGGPQVEGFTSLMYVLLLSLLYSITGNIDSSSVAINLCIFLAVVGVTTSIVYSITQRTNKQSSTQWLGGLLLVWMLANPYFAIWLSIAQMDVGLWTLMILLALSWCLTINLKERLFGQLITGGLIVILLALTRPEGMLLGLLVPFSWLLKVILEAIREKQHSIQLMLRQSLIGVCLLGIWVSAITSLTWFRLQYFGWPLPNTYYAKVSPDLWYRIGQGLLYAWSFLIHQPVMLVILGVGLYLTIVSLRSLVDQKTFSLLVIDSFFVVLLLLPIFNGGDHFAGWRMYQPIWPIAGILGILYLSKLPPTWYQALQKRYTTVAVGSVFFVILLVSQFYFFGHSRMSLDQFRYEFTIAEQGRYLGTVFNEWFSDTQKKPVVGVITAGGFAMTYQGEVYDLFGLNDISIAHNGGQRKGFKNHASLDPELVSVKSPEFLLPKDIVYGVLVQSSSLSQILMQNTQFAQTLFAYKPLKEQYVFVWLTQEKLTAIGIHLTAPGVAVFVRKDYLANLKTIDKFQIVEIAIE